MPIPNRISSALTGENKTGVGTGLDAVTTNLPLVDLTDKERASLNHLKERNLGFVKSSLELAMKNQGFLPRDFDLAEFQKDAALFDDLFSIKQAVASLLQRIEDTTNLAGNEAYAAALAVYGYARVADVGTEGIDPYLDEMARRFARKSRSSAAPEPVE